MSDLGVIVIQIDSFNRHFLRNCGNGWIETPNLDRHYLTRSVAKRGPLRRRVLGGAHRHVARAHSVVWPLLCTQGIAGCATAR